MRGSGEGTPAAAAIEQVALRWVAELLELPAASGVLVTGAQMANFVGLAAARAEVLRAAGWDIEADGLAGAPPIRVVVGAERHGTIDKRAAHARVRHAGRSTWSMPIARAGCCRRARRGARRRPVRRSSARRPAT